MKTSLPLLFAIVSVLEACASTPTAATTSATTPRRRRPRAAQIAAPVAQPDGAAIGAGGMSRPTAVAQGPSVPRASERRPDAGAMDSRTPARSFGTPVVASGGDLGSLRPAWTPAASHARVRCEGMGPSTVPSPQSPYDPPGASIVRSFLPAERRVLACRPPTNERGRLPVHGFFSSNGAPTEFVFPEVSISRDQALCVAEALCGVRLPAFRAPNASVDYQFVVAVPEG